MSFDSGCQLMIEAPTHNLLDLPEEVISIVFYELPTSKDVLALASTCHRLRDVAFTQSSLWKSQMTKHFPSMAVYFQRKLRKAADQQSPDMVDLAEYWRKKLVRRLRVESELRRELEAFSAYNFYATDFSKVHSEEFADRVVACFRGDFSDQDERTQYVIDGLLQIIHGTHPDEMLNLKHYARKLLYYVRSQGLQRFWRDFKEDKDVNPTDGNYLEGLMTTTLLLPNPVKMNDPL